MVSGLAQTFHQRFTNDQKYMKRYSVSLIIREMQIKTKEIRIVENQLLYSVAGNANGATTMENSIERFLKKLNIELPYDSVIHF